MFKNIFICAALMLSAAFVYAGYPDEVEVSTAPIGDSYYRHLAQMTHIDLRELVKFQRRGFGRTEINILILISSGSVQTLKDYGNRRLKDNVPLNVLIADAHQDHDTIYAKAGEMKADIEAMGDANLPPPIYEVDASTATVKPVEKKESKKKKSSEKKDPIDAKPVIPKPESGL